jgi:hypothetical protein
VIQRKDDSVRVAGVQPEVLFALHLVETVYERHGDTAAERVCVVNSITDPDPNRKPSSLHPKGFAIDFGIRHVARARWKSLADAIAAAVGSEFDVVLELGNRPHIHVEFDPK